MFPPLFKLAFAPDTEREGRCKGKQTCIFNFCVSIWWRCFPRYNKEIRDRILLCMTIILRKNRVPFESIGTKCPPEPTEKKYSTRREARCPADAISALHDHP